MAADPTRIFLIVNGKRMSLAKLIANPTAATTVRVDNCPGLAALPELPAATTVRVDNCPGLAILNAGADWRGNAECAAFVEKLAAEIAAIPNFTAPPSPRVPGARAS